MTHHGDSESAGRAFAPPRDVVQVPAEIDEADRRRGKQLLAKMADLDALDQSPAMEAKRAKLRAAAEEIGIRLVSIQVTWEPLHDPDIEALSPADRKQIADVTRRLHEEPRRAG